MRRFVAGLMLVGLLAACGQADQMAASPGIEAEEAAPAPPMASYGGADRDEAQNRASGGEAAPADGATAPSSGPGQGSQPTGPAPVLYLAYSYQMGFELPSQRLSSVMDRHIAACQNAGPRLCQLIGSNKSGDPEAYMEGHVSLRGEPAWLRTFMGGMAAEVDDAGGRVVTQTTNTEDLTRAMVDTEARLNALLALRTRLQDLLRSRPGRLADLLEVERELARVQSEIDSIQSNLAVMRTRVAMSELTLSYRSQPRSVRSDTWEPLRDAFANFLGIVVGGIAGIVTLIAFLIPFAIVIVPIVWLLMRWRRSRGGRFFRRGVGLDFERDQPPPPAPPAANT